MADYTLGDLKSQVALLSGDNNIASKVTVWANRVVSDLNTRAFWTRQTKRMQISAVAGNAANATSNTPQGQMISFTHTTNPPIAIAGLQQAYQSGTVIGTYGPALVRCSPMDLWRKFAGTNSVAANTATFYAPLGYTGSTNATTAASNAVPPAMQFALHPAIQTVGTGANSSGVFLPSALTHMALLNGDTDTHWILSKYFRLVLNGVMRMVRMYQGQTNQYLQYKADFEDGVRQMILQEEAMVAGTPVMRSIESEYWGRS
jgi:hypothetical protein